MNMFLPIKATLSTIPLIISLLFIPKLAIASDSQSQATSQQQAYLDSILHQIEGEWQVSYVLYGENAIIKKKGEFELASAYDPIKKTMYAVRVEKNASGTFDRYNEMTKFNPDGSYDYELQINGEKVLDKQGVKISFAASENHITAKYGSELFLAGISKDLQKLIPIFDTAYEHTILHQDDIHGHIDLLRGHEYVGILMYEAKRAGSSSGF